MKDLQETSMHLVIDLTRSILHRREGENVCLLVCIICPVLLEADVSDKLPGRTSEDNLYTTNHLLRVTLILT